MPVKFETCPLFDESVIAAAKKDSNIIQLIKDFKNFKSKDPLAQYSDKDQCLAPNTAFTIEVPKIRKARLKHDSSIYYTLSGKDPHVIKLYGVFSHDDAGIGQPQNIKKQKTLANRMARQHFN